MASNDEATSDDSSRRNKRQKLGERFAAREDETNESTHGSPGFHISVFEGISLLKSGVPTVKSELLRLKSTMGCVVMTDEILKQQVFQVQELVCKLKCGDIEATVSKAIHDVMITGANTNDKVAENIIRPMKENGEHDLVEDICKDSKKDNFSVNCPITLNSGGKHQICGEISANKVDNLADLRVTDKGNEKSDTMEEARATNRNKNFPLIGKISRKNSKVLKYLFGKPRKGGLESREEVARSGDFGVSLEDIQCLCPTVPISSKVINIWVAYLCQTNSDSWFLPTFFGEQARLNVDPSVVPASVASIIVHCRLQRFHRRLKHCVQISSRCMMKSQTTGFCWL